MAAAAGDFSQPSQPSHRGADRLCSELCSSWQFLADLSSRLSEASSSLRVPDQLPESLQALREQYEAETRALLLGPVEEFLRFRPIRRSLEAMRECDREITARAISARAKIDWRFQKVMAQTALDLCEPWRIHRSGGHAITNQESEWRDWEQRRAAHAKEAAVLLERYIQWASGTAATSATSANVPESGNLESGNRETWWRQQRAVNALLEMEVSCCELANTWFRATEEFAANVARERHEILSAGSDTLTWIRNGAPAEANTEALDVVSPDERLRTWMHKIEDEAAGRLPERIELVVPGRYPRWRQVAARDVFLSAFATYAQAPMSQIVRHYWSGSATIVREVSRAREIVEYWREASLVTSPNSRPDSGDLHALFADALHNASTMLAGQIQTPVATKELDAKLKDAFRTWREEGSTALEAAQSGWIVLLQRPRGRRFLRAATRLEEQKLRKAAHHTGRWVSHRWDLMLEAAGVRLPTRPTAQPVVRRTTLRDTLSLPASKSELPALYHSLFRLAPVQDRRFLIGRDQELAGLEQALRDWDAGRFAACLVVGARGSGKTSLLNCAATQVFADRPLVRGQFEDRLLTSSAIDRFLRQLLSLDPDTDLETALASERRILMIEESERTYLRKTGGFEGVRHLIHLIHHTASTTLWVLVTNDKAFRVLDAGAELSRVFSHRINAMSVSRDDLEKAILERHRLSGLQLEFAPPPPGDPRVGRVKRWLRLHDSPQKLFFEALYQQSGGVFRSAFELWLSSIERTEGETLKMRQPLDPAFNQFRNELAQQDHFTLLAIHEHGSLTQDELAEVLCEAPEASRSRMDRLWALGLIESDPEHPGLRVRPEAQRFTNDLLRRANLT